MDKIMAVVMLGAVLLLVSRGLPATRWPVVIAGTLAFILFVVMAEQYGWWPAGWKVR